MRSFKDHIIPNGTNIKNALAKLDYLAADAILFIIDSNGKLLGSLTDGDVRRGFLKNLTLDDVVDDFIQHRPKYIRKNSYEIDEIISLRNNKYKILPVLNHLDQIVNVINFRFVQSYLPLDAIIMAGGRGSRLKPLTDTVPKPLLKVGDKPIIEHNIDHLSKYGVDDFWISLRYLGDQIKDHLGNGEKKHIKINYVWETDPLGTIGAVSLIENLTHDTVLLTNSDILTTMDFEDFYLDFIKKGAEMSVATIPYAIDIPYAILETDNNHIISFKEKPTYTHYANAGIYLMQREILNFIPKKKFYNSTDLMEELIRRGKKLISYPIRQYWLDIGKHEDYKKAQDDILHIKY